MENQTIGEFIKNERNDNKISIAQLAESSGVSSPYISQIESNTRNPSPKVLKQIYEGFSKHGIKIPYSFLLSKAGYFDLSKEVEMEEQISALLYQNINTTNNKGNTGRYNTLTDITLNAVKQSLKSLGEKINNNQSAEDNLWVPFNLKADDSNGEQFHLNYNLDEILKFKKEQINYKDVHLSKSEVNLIRGFIELLIENREE